MTKKKPDPFEADLKDLINKHGKDGDSATPDFVLARLLLACLTAFEEATNKRDEWYGQHEKSEITGVTQPAEFHKKGFLLKLEEIRNRLKRK